MYIDGLNRNFVSKTIQMIQSHGNSASPVFFVGDGGTESDVLSNYALSGQTDMKMKQLCPDSIWVDSWKSVLVKERVDLYTKNYYESNTWLAQVEKYKDIFVQELNAINPYLIIPLNEGVFRFLTGLRSIYKFRGSVLPCEESLGKYKVLPVLGPKPFLDKEYRLFYVSQIDCNKIPRYANDTALPEQNLNIWIAENANDFQQFINRMQGKGPLNFDIETLLGIPTAISLCFDGQESVSVPLTDRAYPATDRAVMLWTIAKLLANPSIPKGNQNVKFDWRHIEKINLSLRNVAYDTNISASLLMPEFDKDLGFLNSIYTEIPYFKGEGKEWDPQGHKNKTKFYLYNAKDSLATWRINATQQEEIDSLGLRYVHDKLVTLIPIYKKMEDNGLRFDDTQRKFLLAKYYSTFEIQLLKVRNLINNYAFNPQSWKQCETLIFDTLGYKKMKGVTGTDEESLDWLVVYGEPKHATPERGRQVLQQIQICRKVHKVIEYLETPFYPDHRWRSSYNLGGTTTGRTTAGKTTDEWIWKTVNKKEKVSYNAAKLGRSFQTIAKHGFLIDGVEYGKDLRTMFVPSPGHVFVEVDLSQAEARVDAVLAGNFDILKVFDGPVGIHKLTGSWVFNCEPSEIKKNQVVEDPHTGISVDRYLMAKTARHAAERNMREDRLAVMTQQMPAACKIILDRIHGEQPELREVFHHDIIQTIKLTKTLVAPNGRRRQFLGRPDNSTFNEAISFLPQVIVSDQMKFSLIPTMDEFPTARLINEAHDGVLAEVLEGREMEYATIFKKNVETHIDFNSCTLSRNFQLLIPCEVSISKTNWFELKEVKL